MTSCSKVPYWNTCTHETSDERCKVRIVNKKCIVMPSSLPLPHII